MLIKRRQEGTVDIKCFQKLWFVFRENATECVWNWEASMLPSLHLAVYLYAVHVFCQLLCLGPFTRLEGDEIAGML